MTSEWPRLCTLQLVPECLSQTGTPLTMIRIGEVFTEIAYKHTPSVCDIVPAKDCIRAVLRRKIKGEERILIINE